MVRPIHSLLLEKQADHGSAVSLQLHIDAYSAMTGASLFTYQQPQWIYNRTETIDDPADFEGFDVLITHNPSLHLECFRPRKSVVAFAGFSLDRNILGCIKNARSPLEPKWQELITIAQRREDCRATVADQLSAL